MMIDLKKYCIYFLKKNQKALHPSTYTSTYVVTSHGVRGWMESMWEV